jgi:hypothetical protein
MRASELALRLHREYGKDINSRNCLLVMIGLLIGSTLPYEQNKEAMENQKKEYWILVRNKLNDLINE